MVHIWKPRNYLMPLLVIPYKDANGLIQACQIRLHANDISFNEKRYCWLSSPQERFGTSSGTPIHFTIVKEKLPPGETVLITEGALKADTVVRFRPNARVIATAGVTCSHSELVEAARPYTALIAFDADYRTNPAVCRQLARLIVQRVNDSREQLRSTTNVLCWNGPKGIDDAVRANVRLRSLTISEWYETLNRNSVRAHLHAIGASPVMWEEITPRDEGPQRATRPSQDVARACGNGNCVSEKLFSRVATVTRRGFVALGDHETARAVTLECLKSRHHGFDATFTAA
jgi:hypothetical protein